MRSSAADRGPSFYVAWRRLTVVMAFALWFGGFTFYAGIVIPTAQAVLRSHVRVGFITRRVTGWINVLGVIVLVALLWEMLATRRSPFAKLRWSTWAVMAVAQLALVLLHPCLDALL